MIRGPAIITAINLTTTPRLQSFPASDLSYSNTCQLINKPIFNPILASVHSQNMLTIDFVNKIIFSPTATSLRLRRVVLQRTTGKMTGCEMVIVFFSLLASVMYQCCLALWKSWHWTQYLNLCLLFLCALSTLWTCLMWLWLLVHCVYLFMWKNSLKNKYSSLYCI